MKQLIRKRKTLRRKVPTRTLTRKTPIREFIK